MNPRLYPAIFGFAFLLLAQSVTLATPVPVYWTINSTASSFTLSLPDQQSVLNDDGPIEVGPVSITARVRNAQGSANTWTNGNTSAMAGMVATTWDPNPSDPMNPVIAFTGSGSSIVGVNAGSFRPNSATYTGGTVNSDGTASGGNFANTSGAPAEFGGAAQLGDQHSEHPPGVLQSLQCAIRPAKLTANRQRRCIIRATGLDVGISQSLLNVLAMGLNPSPSGEALRFFVLL